MPRRALPSNSAEAALRAHFGLTQAELGRFLGVTAAQVGHVEAGRNAWSATAAGKLRLLEWLLPPADGGVGPEPPGWETADLPELPGSLDSRALRRHLRDVRFQAVKIRYDLEQRHKRARAEARRRWGVAVLRTLLAPAAGQVPPPAVVSSPAFNAEAVGRWLAMLEADVAAAPTALTPTRQALLALRLRLLEEEAAALEGLLQ